ncbi:MAG: hypothetical protein AAB855_05175 [Patescibacteria group bacterium]
MSGTEPTEPTEPTQVDRTIEAVRNLDINETPTLEAEYEKRRGYLAETLDKISAQDLAQTKENIRNAKESATDDELLKLQDLEMAIDAILSFRSKEDKQGVLDSLAQRKIYELANANQLNSYCAGELRTALHNLNEAVFALVRIKFPEALAVQRKAKEEADKVEIERRRDELMKINVK